MSDIDGYLDEMFDRLSGTGAAGRRTLAETEEHLRDAVADGIGRGLTADEAEREALARFGPAAPVVRGIKHAAHGARYTRLLSGTWLVIALTLGGAGLAYLVAALNTALLRSLHPNALPACGPVVGPCTYDVQFIRSDLLAGAVLLGLGVVLLVGRRFSPLHGRLPRHFPWWMAGLLTLAGLFAFAAGPPRPVYIARHGVGLPIGVLAAGLVIIGALGCLTWGTARTIRYGVRARSGRT